MKIVFITGGLSPYRVAFCDCVNSYMERTQKGEMKLFLLSDQGFNSNYDNNLLMRSYAEVLKGKTLVMPDNTTRFMINPGIGKRIAEEKPDFVILGGSWTHPSTWLLLLCKKRIGAPIYFWAESHLHNGLKRKQRKAWKEFFKKHIYNHFDGFFAPGEYAREAILQTGCRKRQNCVQLPNLVENEKYRKAAEKRLQRDLIRAQYGIEQDRVVLFTPSRLVDLKGIMEFLESGTRELSDSQITWVVAGMGPLKEKLEAYANAHCVDLRLPGFVDQKTVVDYLALSDWFLLPSLSDPNPLSVIEALWAKLPLALSQYVGNVPETLEEEKNGISFNTLSEESVCRALVTMKNCDSEWLRSAGLRSGEIAQEHFEMGKETERIVLEIERRVKSE